MRIYYGHVTDRRFMFGLFRSDKPIVYLSFVRDECSV